MKVTLELIAQKAEEARAKVVEAMSLDDEALVAKLTEISVDLRENANMNALHTPFPLESPEWSRLSALWSPCVKRKMFIYFYAGQEPYTRSFHGEEEREARLAEERNETLVQSLADICTALKGTDEYLSAALFTGAKEMKRFSDTSMFLPFEEGSAEIARVLTLWETAGAQVDFSFKPAQRLSLSPELEEEALPERLAS